MTETAITIIPFTTAYTAAVIAHILPIQQDEFAIPITADDQPDLKDIANFYQQGEGNFWLAIDQGRVVGTIALRDIGNQQAALRKMFVHPDFRGAANGTAGRLLDTLLDWARNHGLREIYLGTNDKLLAAQRFYTKHGFTEAAKPDLPPQFPVMAVDSKFYRYRLDAPAVQIRRIKPHELAELLALYSHLHPSDKPLPDEAVVQALWDEIMRNPRLYYMVAETAGRLVATCTLTIIPNLTRGTRPYGLIENVVTHLDYRQRGIGNQMLRYTLDIAW